MIRVSDQGICLRALPDPWWSGIFFCLNVSILFFKAKSRGYTPLMHLFLIHDSAKIHPILIIWIVCLQTIYYLFQGDPISKYYDIISAQFHVSSFHLDFRTRSNFSAHSSQLNYSAAPHWNYHTCFWAMLKLVETAEL